ncbi:MAG: transporter substrate-binding domain-containing protein, partial [candidate division WOR-3 bacterium]|nr:transporter substrate-binding domain-containing protein [candidate division WOR-3 bacterium]
PTFYYAYAVRQDDQAVLNALNDGLQKLMATEKWRELREKYNMSL